MLLMLGYWYCSSCCRINVQVVIDEKVVVLVILLLVVVLLGITVIWVVVVVVASVERRGRSGRVGRGCCVDLFWI